jgi:hypothetical protein
VKILGAGDIGLKAPRTIVSGSPAGFYEPLLVFLGEMSRAIPPGATVSLAPPDGRDPHNWMDYMVAIGQLPRLKVVFAARFLPAGPTAAPIPGVGAPRFVACFGGEFHDRRYRLVRLFSEGRLYEAVP